MYKIDLPAFCPACAIQNSLKLRACSGRCKRMDATRFLDMATADNDARREAASTHLHATCGRCGYEFLMEAFVESVKETW